MSAPQGRSASAGATELRREQAAAFVRDGFLTVPGMVPAAKLRAATTIAHSVWERCGRQSGWNSLRPERAQAKSLEGLLLDGDVASVVSQLTPSPYNVSTQIVVSTGTRPHPPRPHLDGPRSTATPSTFTLMVGVFLTDLEDPGHGNLCVWPGSHMLASRFFNTHGPDAIRTVDRFPDVDLGDCPPVQITARAGDIVFASYLLGHGAGPNSVGSKRITIYFRLRATGHGERWQDCLLDPFSEFSPLVADALASAP
jgi:hypothetical protein